MTTLAHRSPLRRITLVTIGLIATTAVWQPVQAQTWPERPIKVIVPIGAGSAADVVPRLVFDQVAAQTGQPAIFENRPGAGGSTGAAAVAKATADGYTLLAMSSSYTILPAVYRSMPFDAKKDLIPVLPLGSLPNVLVVAPDKGFRSLADLVAAAKAKPGALNYGSVGNGTALHLNAERLRLSAGIDVKHVPFKAAPELATEVLTGRIDFAFIPVSLALPLIKDGKLQALAVGSAKRASVLPDVPTTLEAGLPNSDYNFWLAVFAPAGTPQAIIEKLSQEVRKALQVPAVRDKLAKVGVEPMDMDTAHFGRFVHQDA